MRRLAVHKAERYSRLFEVGSVFMRGDDVASGIVNANHGIM
jgi:hypothetical protein